MPVAGAAGFVAGNMGERTVGAVRHVDELFGDLGGRTVHGDVEDASFHHEGTALAPFGRDHFVDEVALGRGAREVFEEKRRV